ncbi:MAG: adenosylmethionine decarboxylase [Bacteroidota bacterium]
MQPIGRHLIVEYYNCPGEILDNTDLIEELMKEAALAAGAHIRSVNFHKFDPIGVSGVIIIQESHLTIHTWPDQGYAAVDIFTCGDSVDPWKGFESLKNSLKCTDSRTKEMFRGAELKK